jgi:hypothetical protein
MKFFKKYKKTVLLAASLLMLLPIFLFASYVLMKSNQTHTALVNFAITDNNDIVRAKSINAVDELVEHLKVDLTDKRSTQRVFESVKVARDGLHEIAMNAGDIRLKALALGLDGELLLIQKQAFANSLEASSTSGNEILATIEGADSEILRVVNPAINAEWLMDFANLKDMRSYAVANGFTKILISDGKNINVVIANETKQRTPLETQRFGKVSA